MKPGAHLSARSRAHHVAVGLPQRYPLLRRQIHRVTRLDVEGGVESALVAQRAVGAELSRRVRIHLEAFDPKTAPHLVPPDLRKTEEQPLFAAIAVDHRRRAAGARKPVGAL